MHDAIAAVEFALDEAAEMFGGPLRDLAQVDDEGNVVPVVTIVTDNGGPFRSFRFEAFIATHPELRHVRTRVRPRAERVTRTRLRVPEVRATVPRGDPRRPGPGRARRALPGRVQHRPTPRGDRLEPPIEVHLGYADPVVPNFPEPQNLPSA